MGSPFVCLLILLFTWMTLGSLELLIQHPFDLAIDGSELIVRPALNGLHDLLIHPKCKCLLCHRSIVAVP